MRNLSNNKGITLITLITTIIVLIILASVAAYSGINVINSSKLTVFTTEMKLAQTKINELYNKMQTGEKLVIDGVTYKSRDDDSANNTKGFKNIGDSVTSDTQATTAINKAHEVNNSYSTNVADYKKYTANTMKNLGFEGIEQELLIDIVNRKVISYKGLTQKDVTYYVLEQLPDGMYNVDYSNGNTGNPGIDTSYEEIGNGKYKINVSVAYLDGNIEKWNVKYKLTTEEQWSISYDLSFIVEHAGVYDIKVENQGIESEISQLRVTSNENAEYRDANGDVASIPGGFFVSNVSGENTIDEGLVVIGPDDSEFVWVPVDKKTLCADGTEGKEIAKLTSGTDLNGKLNYEGKLYDFSGTTSTEMSNYGQGTESYREPGYLTDTSSGDASSYNTIGITSNSLQEEYNAIIDSIKNNGGFYVGRYEASISGETIKTVKDVLPMNATTNNQMWYGMYKKEQEYAIKLKILHPEINLNLKSAMITGSCYDAMLNWAIKGADAVKVTQNINGNHSYSVAKTGNSTYSNDKINNIFDLEGNMLEWTSEANSTNGRVVRRR